MTEKLEIWRGRQWSVTTAGLRVHHGYRYEIEVRGLGASRIGEPAHSDWLLHMAEKEWVDIDDFVAAWCVAIAVHRTPLAKIDVRDSIRVAHKERARCVAWEQAHPPNSSGWYSYAELTREGSKS